MRRKRFLLIPTAAILCACEKEYPYPIEKSQVQALVLMAEEAAKHCDDLLKDDNCYGRTGEPDTPQRSLPRPREPLGGVSTLGSLEITCEPKTPGRVACRAEPYRWVPDCGQDWRHARGWKLIPEDSEGEEIRISTSPGCVGAWVVVGVQRKTPLGNKVTLSAVFVAPEAERDGGIIQRLRAERYAEIHDGEVLCAEETFQLCYSPISRGRGCASLDFRTEIARSNQAALAAEKDPIARAKIAQRIAFRIGRPCPVVPAVRNELHRLSFYPGWQTPELPKLVGRPIVTLDTPVVEGALEPAQVAEVASRALPDFQRCFNLAHVRLRTPNVGAISVSMDVSTSGRVTAIEPEHSDFGDPPLFSCLGKTLKSIRLPSATAPSRVSLRLTDSEAGDRAESP